jgi:hypothetical protein
MGRLPAAGWESDRLGGRNVATDFLAKDERATQDAVSSVVQVEIDERRGLRRRPADEHGPPSTGTELGYVSKFGRNDVAALGPRIDTNQRPDAVADEA